jgi:hypothetical protein
VEVEDALARALVGVFGRPQQRQPEPGRQEYRRGESEDERAVIP